MQKPLEGSQKYYIAYLKKMEVLVLVCYSYALLISLAGTNDYKYRIDFRLLDYAEQAYGAHLPLCIAEF